jgi:hypothetical protein
MLIAQKNTHTVDDRAGLIVELKQFEFAQQSCIVDAVELSQSV